MEEKKILVIYVGVAGLSSDEVYEYTHEVADKVIPSTFYGEIIVIPVLTNETRIDCINPKYITDKELIKNNTELMKKLNNELKNQSKLLKNDE